MDGKIAYSTKEACAALGIKRSKLYEFINEGRLEARRLGRRTLIDAESVRQFYLSLPRDAAHTPGLSK